MIFGPFAADTVCPMKRKVAVTISIRDRMKFLRFAIVNNDFYVHSNFLAAFRSCRRDGDVGVAGLAQQSRIAQLVYSLILAF